MFFFVSYLPISWECFIGLYSQRNTRRSKHWLKKHDKQASKGTAPRAGDEGIWVEVGVALAVAVELAFPLVIVLPIRCSGSISCCVSGSVCGNVICCACSG